MKNSFVCVSDGIGAAFADGAGSNAYIRQLPSKLAEKLLKQGEYRIARIAGNKRRGFVVSLTHFEGFCPAKWVETHYPICNRFLNELGITRPRVGQVKRVRLVVTPAK